MEASSIKGKFILLTPVTIKTIGHKHGPFSHFYCLHTFSQDADEDLKNHPTIVKNGGANGTTNGTSSETPAEVEAGKVEAETTNINPELSTVTWTAENNKTEADMHLEEAEQKPLKEETEEKE